MCDFAHGGARCVYVCIALHVVCAVVCVCAHLCVCCWGLRGVAWLAGGAGGWQVAASQAPWVIMGKQQPALALMVCPYAPSLLAGRAGDQPGLWRVHGNQLEFEIPGKES